MLVSGHLSRWARTWAGVGAAECTAVATSIYFRPTPVIAFLPGSNPMWASSFFAVGAAFLGIAALLRTPRRVGMFCFAIAATGHAMYGIGALGYAVSMGQSWVLASCMLGLAALDLMAAWKIAGARH